MNRLVIGAVWCIAACPGHFLTSSGWFAVTVLNDLGPTSFR